MQANKCLNISANFKNIIFDLDGTLVDSVNGIIDSLNAAISVTGMHLCVENFKEHMGPPLREIIYRMWPSLETDEAERLIGAFRDDYHDRGCLNTDLYPGLLRELCRLSQESFPLYILTNKPLKPTLKILQNLDLERHFQALHSPDSPSCGFDSKSEGAALMAALYNLCPSETLMVGDSYEDQRAAEEAGFFFVRAGYGYGNSGFKHDSRRWPVLDTPPMLAAFLANNIRK
jgi:phosphoglycolate phosphatase